LERGQERSARYEPIEIGADLATTAVRSVGWMGLEVAAVDILDEASGPKVYQVDGSPPLLALERATGLDLAGTIVDHAGSLLREPIRGSGIG
jgi:ribosomal protein S6--L-glutamate ligase